MFLMLAMTLLYFNPRSPCGERLLAALPRCHPFLISIHAPRVGSDQKPQRGLYIENIFQSTLPVWGATAAAVSESAEDRISIHAPRVGSDKEECSHAVAYTKFQSTLPVWGATRHRLAIVDGRC